MSYTVQLSDGRPVRLYVNNHLPPKIFMDRECCYYRYHTGFYNIPRQTQDVLWRHISNGNTLQSYLIIEFRALERRVEN